MNLRIIVSFIIINCLTISCIEPEPEPIKYGEDHCAYCEMTIADPKFGAELVTDKGRVYKFDATECMIPYMEEHSENYHHVLVTPFDNPKTLIPANECFFIISDNIRSPMGANLLTFKEKNKLKDYSKKSEIMEWEQLKKFIIDKRVQ